MCTTRRVAERGPCWHARQVPALRQGLISGPASERGGAVTFTGGPLRGLALTAVGLCAPRAPSAAVGRSASGWRPAACRRALPGLRCWRPELDGLPCRPACVWGAHRALRQDARPPRPQAAAPTAWSRRTCMDLRTHDLPLLRGLASRPALAVKCIDGDARVSVSVPQCVRSLYMRGPRRAPYARPSAWHCRACSGSPLS